MRCLECVELGIAEECSVECSEECSVECSEECSAECSPAVLAPVLGVSVEDIEIEIEDGIVVAGAVAEVGAPVGVGASTAAL